MSLTKDLEIPKDLFEMANQEYECKWIVPKVVIKRFTRGDISAIESECVKVKANSSFAITADINPSDLKDFTVLKAVVNAPWPCNDMNSVKNLPPFIFEWLEVEINSFNTLPFKVSEAP